jgi:hypothetical protein
MCSGCDRGGCEIQRKRDGSPYMGEARRSEERAGCTRLEIDDTNDIV